MAENTKIDWCDATVNSSNGCRNRELLVVDTNGDIQHICPLGKDCYAARMMIRFPERYPNGMNHPTTNHEKIDAPLKIKKPSRIFINSMGDTFGQWQEFEYIDDLLLTALKNEGEKHRFLFLTKDPENMNRLLHDWARYHEANLPKNCWFGTTITSEKDAWKVDRLCNSACMTRNLFLSIEPLLGDVTCGGKTDFRGIPWIIIGAKTPDPMKNLPLMDWITLDRALEALPNKPAIFLKGSMKKALVCDNVRQEFPPGLRRWGEQIVNPPRETADEWGWY